MPQSLDQRPWAARRAFATRSVRFAGTAGLRRALLLPLFLLAVAALNAGAGAQTIPIHKIDWSFIAPDPAAATGPDAVVSRTTFGLPLRWPSEADSPLRTVALRMHFALTEVPDRTWALLMAHATEGGRFSVNGHFIGTIAAESEWRHVAWRRPQLLAIDPSLLLAGDNEVLIETAFGPGVHLLSGVEVGSLSELWNHYALQLFLFYLWDWAGEAVALLIMIVFGALWIQRRDVNSGLLALASACWLVSCAMGLVEIMPVGMRFGVHLAGMASMAAFTALLALCLLRLCELRRPGWEWFIWIFAAIGPLLSVLTATRADPYLDRSWQPGLILIIAIVTGLGLYRRTQGLAAPKALVLFAAIVLIFGAVLDFGAAIGHNDLDGVQALHFASPLMLLALATPLMDGFMKMMHETEAARNELESRVREREQLLKRNFERLRESERVKVEAQERQRIMQDMHDGLGSQLMSSLMLVERGAVSNDQFAQILRESIDDMRLAIDALAADDADLAAALGNLRFRMEPRLRAAGMELTWDARRLPEELGLHPDVVLPILRIVQEALTNALKHSRARAVRVTLATEGTGDAQSLDIRIADNGRGIGEERVGGRGLLNMRNRAQKIGAQLKIETAVNVGTTVHLRTRIGPTTPSVKTSQTILNTQAIIEHARQGN
jgi:signal transduction histidine kinase